MLKSILFKKGNLMHVRSILAMNCTSSVLLSFNAALACLPRRYADFLLEHIIHNFEYKM